MSRFEILLDKYEKNKDKYLKFLTFVSQFSASLENIQKTYDAYKNIWSIISTPLEIIYPALVPINNWGTFDIKTGNITEDIILSRNEVSKIVSWVNDKFPEQEYGTYKNISIRVYFYMEIAVPYKMSASFVEECYAGGASTQVCCNGCGISRGHQGCNRMGPDGKTCGNMYNWCPGPFFNSTNCASGSCKGWELGQNRNTWKSTRLSISRTITFPNDRFFIGYRTLRLRINNRNVWERI
jgi:hypothetical protein